MPEGWPGVTRLVIVDDHVILREGLASLLDGQPDFQVVGEAGSVAEAIDMVIELNPDLVLMDYSLPDGTGIKATKSILKERPETIIVFLTVHETDDELFGAIRSGVKGYLVKNIPVSELLDQLRGMAQGETAMSDDMVGRIITEFSHSREPLGTGDGTFDHLTPRELEVFRELSRGASNQEIANKLVISINTVKNHVHNILEKLEVNNRREAAKLGAKHGLT